MLCECECCGEELNTDKGYERFGRALLHTSCYEALQEELDEFEEKLSKADLVRQTAEDAGLEVVELKLIPCSFDDYSGIPTNEPW